MQNQTRLVYEFGSRAMAHRIVFKEDPVLCLVSNICTELYSKRTQYYAQCPTYAQNCIQRGPSTMLCVQHIHRIVCKEDPVLCLVSNIYTELYAKRTQYYA
eukprot:TRINITY_DN14026_c0_g1_i1.p1 TRINITY_DN14026_c0_g1~~TRINITY_DN14026_c0_g1_i1.p1  ORF type:complete len:101 (-),score=0.65 TRINITY_DN14026_c0_g1_i1:66-368(-)